MRRSGRNEIVRVGKSSGPVLSPLWTNVHEILGQCRRPFVLSKDLARLSTSRFIQRVFAIKPWNRWKPNKCKSSLAPIFFDGTTPTFLQQIVSANYLPPFGKVWLSSVCWCPSAKPGNEVDSRIYVGWAKMAVTFEAVCGPKFTLFWDDVGDPCSCQCTWLIVYIMFHSEDIGV